LERKLAAIFYADVAGYSRLTGEDEEGTHRTLSVYLDAISAAIGRHNGKVLHYAGDAILADFATVSDALTCAAAVQHDLEHRNREIVDNRKVRFRIGVNLGDVIVDRNEIYGDGVNVAARLESLAEPGGICISEAVRAAVGNRLPLDFEFLGEQRVKNIAEPVKAYHARLKPNAELPKPKPQPKARRRARPIAAAALVALFAIGAGVAVWFAPWSLSVDQAGLSLPDKASIAVLPFDNLSGDANDEYFSDGITNDIITDLSKFSSLVVIASNSAFIYKGQSVKVQVVGRNLGVRYVLEGTTQRAGDKVRINAQLIDASTGHHLWAERYDRNFQDLFEVQDEIVRMIVTTLALKVSAVERERALRKDTSSLEAYDYLLRGREDLSRRTRSKNLEAREKFQRAIEIDPDYAIGYVELGRTYRLAFSHGWTEFPGQALEKAYELAQKALNLEDSAAARRLLGSIYLAREQYDLAVQALERALALNPNDWDSEALLGSVMLYSGRPDEAVQALSTALRLNPGIDVDRLFHLGLAYYLKGRYDDSIVTLERGVGRVPDHPFLHIALAAAYAQAGRAEDASRTAAKVMKLHPFFEVNMFGTRFSNPEDRAVIAEGLRKAGLK
jgi:adenylate cyclase